MPNGTKTYLIEGSPVDVAEEDVNSFLGNYPDATEASSFIVEGDTVDVETPDVEQFLTQFPDAQPTFGDEIKKKDEVGADEPTELPATGGLPDIFTYEWEFDPEKIKESLEQGSLREKEEAVDEKLQKEIGTAEGVLKFRKDLFSSPQEDRNVAIEEIAKKKGISEKSVMMALDRADFSKVTELGQDIEQEEITTAKKAFLPQIGKSTMARQARKEGMVDELSDEEVSKILLDKRIEKSVKSMNPDDRKIYTLNNSLQAISKKEGKTPEDIIKIEDLKDQIKDIRGQESQLLWDPKTEELTDEPTTTALNYDKIVNSQVDNLRKNFKGQLADIYNQSYLKFTALDELYNQQVQLKRPDGTIINTTNKELTLPIHDVFIKGDEKLRAERLKNLWIQAKTDFDASTRAYLLNEDPGAVEESFFSIVGTTLARQLPILPGLFSEGVVSTTDEDYIKAYEGLASGAGLEITEAQEEKFKVDLDEKIAEGVGGFLAIIPELAFYGATIETGVGLTGLGRLITRLGESEKVVDKFYKFLLEGSLEEAKTQAAGLEPGAGAGFKLAGLMNLGNFKFGGKYGKYFEDYANKVYQGTAGGTIGMETAAVLESTWETVRHDKGFMDEIHKRFGETLGEAGEKILVDAIVMGMFGGFGAVKSLPKDIAEVRTEAKAQREKGNIEVADFMEDSANKREQAGVEVTKEVKEPTAEDKVEELDVEIDIAKVDARKIELEGKPEEADQMRKDIQDKEARLMDMVMEVEDAKAVEKEEGRIPKDLIGTEVDYGGIKGKIEKVKDGLAVIDAEGEAHFIEGGLNGKTAAELGIKVLAPPRLVTIEQIEESTEPIQEHQVDYNGETGKISIYGKEYTYGKLNLDKNGNPVSLQVTNEKGESHTIKKNQDALLEIEIQKELYENEQKESITVEQVREQVEAQQIKEHEPEIEAEKRGEKPTEPVSEERPTEDIERVEAKAEPGAVEFVEHLTTGTPEQRGKYEVRRDAEGNIRILNVDSGKEVQPTKENRWAIDQYVDANILALRSGKKAKIPQDVTEADIADIIAEESSNPQEIAEAWTSIRASRDPSQMTFEEAVWETAWGIDPKSLRDATGLSGKDVAHLTNRLQKKGGANLDQIVSRVNESLERGERETEAVQEERLPKEQETLSRVIEVLTSPDFKNFKPGKETRDQVLLADRFREVTGLELTEKTADKITDYKSQAEKWADKLEAAAKEIPDATLPFFLAPKIAKFAMETIAAALRAGVKLERAIKLAIAKVKQKMEKGGEFEGEKFEENDLKQFVKEQVGEPFPTKKPPKGKALQKKVEEVTGVKKERPKKMMDTVALYKQQLRDMSKGANLGKKATRKKAKELALELREFLKDKENAENLRTLTGRASVAIVKRVSEIGDSPIRFERTLEYIEKILTKEAFRKEVQAKVTMIEKAEELTSEAKLTKAQAGKRVALPVLKSRTDSNIRIQKLREINEQLKSKDVAKAQEEMNSIVEGLEERRKSGTGDQNLTEAEFERLENLEFSGIWDMNNEKVSSMLSKINEIRDTAKSKAKVEREQRHEAIKTRNQEVMADIIPEGKKVKVGSEKNMVNKKTHSLREELAPDLLWDSSFPSLLNKMSIFRKGKEKIFQEKLTKTFYGDLVSKAESSEIESNAKLNDSKQKAFEKSFNATGGKLKNKILDGKIEEISDVPIIDKDGNKANMYLSQSTALQKWMEYKDPTLRETFHKEAKDGGMGWTEETVTALENYLKPEWKELGEWISGEYSKGGERYNEAYAREFGVDMPINPEYVPITREKGMYTDKAVDMLESQSFQTVVSNGHMKARTQNTNPLRFTDAIDVFNSYQKKMEGFKHWSEPVRVLNETFKDKEVKEAIAQFHGTEYNKIMGWFIDRFAGVDQRFQIDALDRATGLLAKGVLYLKVGIGIKQTFSTMLYSVDMPTLTLGANIGKMLANPKKMKEVYKDISETTTWKNRGEQAFDLDIVSPERKRDYRYRNSELGKLRRNIAIKKDKLINRIPLEQMDRLGGIFIRYGDKTPILLGGGAYYMHKKALYSKTMSPDKAKEKALEDFERITQNTQQSTRISNVSWARGSSSVGRTLFMFTSGAGQVHRLVASAYRELAQGRNVGENTKNILLAHVVLGGMYGLAGNAFKWNDEEQAWSFALGNVKGIAAIGQTLGFMKDKLQGKPWAKSMRISPVIENLTKIFDSAIGLEKELAKEFPNQEKVIEWTQKLVTEIATNRGLPAKGGVKLYKGMSDIITGDVENPIRSALGVDNQYAEGVELWDIFKPRPTHHVQGSETRAQYMSRRKEEDKKENLKKIEKAEDKEAAEIKIEDKMTRSTMYTTQRMIG